MAEIKKKAGRPKGAKNKEQTRVKRSYVRKLGPTKFKEKEPINTIGAPLYYQPEQSTWTQISDGWIPNPKDEAPVQVSPHEGSENFKKTLSSLGLENVTHVYDPSTKAYVRKDRHDALIKDTPKGRSEKSNVVPDPKINKAKHRGVGSGKPLFEKGNVPHSWGRPKGSKNKIMVALEQIGVDNAQAVYAKLVGLALNGDVNACKMILDRVYPLRKGLRFRIEFDGPLDTIQDINDLSKHVLNLVISGEVSAEEAEEYGKVLEQRMKIITDTETMKKIEHTCMLVELMKKGGNDV